MINIFIIAMPGCGNLGDDLISVVLVRKVAERWPMATVGILCGGERNMFEYPENVRLRVFRNPSLHNPKFLRDLTAIHSFLKKADLILVGGGGLFQDSHSFFTIHSWMKYLFLAPTNCPAFAVGVGFGPINNRLNIWYLRKTIRRFSVIQVRDKESNDIVKSLGYRAEVARDIVSGGCLDHLGLDLACEKRKIIGCSIRPWSGLSFEAISNIIKKTCLRYGMDNVRFFVFENSKGNHSELLYAKKLSQYLRKWDIQSTVFCYGEQPIEEFMKSFSEVSVAIAVRYHANILWQMIRTPTMPISYSPKVTNLYQEKIYEINKLDEISECDIKDNFIFLNTSYEYRLPSKNIKKSMSISFKKKLLVQYGIVIVFEILSLFHRVLYGFYWRLKNLFEIRRD